MIQQIGFIGGLFLDYKGVLHEGVFSVELRRAFKRIAERLHQIVFRPQFDAFDDAFEFAERRSRHGNISPQPVGFQNLDNHSSSAHDTIE
jgi:hypothetical protein